VGKSTIASLIIRLLKEKKGGSILGVDADPNSNLGEFLGLVPERSIGDVLNEVAEHKDKIPAGMTKDRYIEYEVQTIIEEGEDFDILAMGRPEGPGCYCYVNNILRGICARLIKDYDYVVIDNEAGLEHLSRKIVAAADILLVVSDATPAGLRAAKRISDLAGELKIKAGKKFILVNRSSGPADREKLSALGLEFLGAVPDDAKVRDLSMKGEPLGELEKSSEAYAALNKLMEKIL